MPEATQSCSYYAITEARIRLAGPDESYYEDVSGQCMSMADHKLVTEIEGRDEPFVEYLCCYHRTQVTDELAHGEHLGVTIKYDLILEAEFEYRIGKMVGPGKWLCVVTIVAQGTGARHTLPPAIVDGATYRDACVKAEAKLSELRGHLIDGDES